MMYELEINMLRFKIVELAVQVLNLISTNPVVITLSDNTKIPGAPTKNKEGQGRYIRGTSKGVSKRGLDAIKKFEGFVSTPYRDAVGVLTVGYGTTTNVTGIVSEQEAEKLMMVDIKKIEDCINSSITCPILQHEYDAIASLIYNIGVGAFKKSTLLRLLNNGKKYDAANAMLKFDKAGGKVLPVLVKRRRSERRMFLASEYVGYDI